MVLCFIAVLFSLTTRRLHSQPARSGAPANMEVGSEVERVYFTLFRTYLFYFLKGVEFGEFGGKSETWP